MPNADLVSTEKLKPLQTGLQWLWLTILFFIVDQVTKHLAVAYIEPYETIEVMPFFNLVIRYNPGAAFSFLADAGGWQVFFFSAVSILVSLGILYWMYTIPAAQKWLSCALALILAGALGNLYDRLTLGEVVDFIDWYYQDYHWPAFNIADSVILLGAAMMLIDSFINPEEKQDVRKK
ncbi:signal peptidase II [Aliikangiella coralliicola]|uniref:Lipoprotein signal peptidase n=1 Tax=Aliikangiella coralliicola TaxID=2592383 RepID=A0A545UAB4_9GAMM|nr:signal peptidase II [Aliikangiella coralliicola]TQV86402.1 lipoprotein signal peptidase [Aliikangiella coralliicola]